MEQSNDISKVVTLAAEQRDANSGTTRWQCSANKQQGSSNLQTTSTRQSSTTPTNSKHNSLIQCEAPLLHSGSWLRISPQITLTRMLGGVFDLFVSCHALSVMSPLTDDNRVCGSPKPLLSKLICAVVVGQERLTMGTWLVLSLQFSSCGRCRSLPFASQVAEPASTRHCASPKMALACHTGPMD
jgi:hypothetical protein